MSKIKQDITQSDSDGIAESNSPLSGVPFRSVLSEAPPASIRAPLSVSGLGSEGEISSKNRLGPTSGAAAAVYAAQEAAAAESGAPTGLGVHGMLQSQNSAALAGIEAEAHRQAASGIERMADSQYRQAEGIARWGRVLETAVGAVGGALFGNKQSKS